MKNVLIGLIRLYKLCLSPVLPGGCRFYPSCSDYSIEALRRHGLRKGSYLTLHRISRCHPFNPGGVDPVK